MACTPTHRAAADTRAPHCAGAFAVTHLTATSPTCACRARLVKVPSCNGRGARPTWFARADARQLKGGSDVAVDGTSVGEADLDPVVVGIGVGARF
jgi:hypothetical protein